MKTKKIISAIIVVAMSASMLIGCSGGNENANSQETTKLTWLFGGEGKLQDSEMVWAEFNKQLQGYLPNTEVEFQVVPMSDYAEKWKMMAAARQEVDLVWAGYTLNLLDEVNKGAFMKLDELVDKNAPELRDELPDWAFEKSSINGDLYFIPCYQMMADGLPIGVRTHKELADKYLDREAVEKAFMAPDKRVFTRADFAPFEEYLQKLKDNGEIRKGVSMKFFEMFASRMGYDKYDYDLVANAVINAKDGTFEVKDKLTDFPQSYEAYDMAREWFEKGYIRSDILGLQDWRIDEGKEDGYVLWAHINMLGQAEKESLQSGFDIDVIPVSDTKLIHNNPTTTNTAISSTSKHPDEAMKLIGLMNTKKGADLYNLLTYGIEGVHYNKVSDSKIEMIVQGQPFTNENKYGYYNWVLGNTYYSYETQYDVEGYNKYVKEEINDKAEKSDLLGFSLDLTPIENEIAQYTTIMKEYEYLSYGATENYKELLEERNQKLKAAGSDKIIEEVQKQVTEWAKK